jgi:hypothetical protein
MVNSLQYKNLICLAHDWNAGAMEYWVMENHGSSLLVKPYFTKKLINDRLSYKIIIPTFHCSKCEAISNSLKNLFNFIEL